MDIHPYTYTRDLALIFRSHMYLTVLYFVAVFLSYTYTYIYNYISLSPSRYLFVSRLHASRKKTNVDHAIRARAFRFYAKVSCTHTRRGESKKKRLSTDSYTFTYPYNTHRERRRERERYEAESNPTHIYYDEQQRK